MTSRALVLLFFFFNDTATTEIYTLSLHDALPISGSSWTAGPPCPARSAWRHASRASTSGRSTRASPRSEEHTSELQSRSDLVCRLLLEKKKKMTANSTLDPPGAVGRCASLLIQSP